MDKNKLPFRKPSTTLVKDKPSTTLVKDKPSTTLVKDKPSTTLVKDKPSTTLVKDKQMGYQIRILFKKIRSKVLCCTWYQGKVLYHTGIRASCGDLTPLCGIKLSSILLFIILINAFSVGKVNSSSPSNPDKVLSQQNQPNTQISKALEQITPEDKKEFEKLLKKILGVSLFEEKQRASQEVLKHRWGKKSGKSIMRVYATSFGTPGNKNESKYFKDGSRVRWGIVAVALPDPSVIGKWVEVRRKHENGKNTQWVKMKVKDLGPWFRDDPYWKRRYKIPRAVGYFKKGKKRFDGRVVINPAGIDITPWGWKKLGVPLNKSHNHSQYVEWRFSS